jgi:hypothetical protein
MFGYARICERACTKLRTCNTSKNMSVCSSVEEVNIGQSSFKCFKHMNDFKVACIMVVFWKGTSGYINTWKKDWETLPLKWLHMYLFVRQFQNHLKTAIGRITYPRGYYDAKIVQRKYILKHFTQMTMTMLLFWHTTAIYKGLKTWHNLLRDSNRDLIFCRRTRWPLCHAASARMIYTC